MEREGFWASLGTKRWRGRSRRWPGARRRPWHGRHAAPCVLAWGRRQRGGGGLGLGATSWARSQVSLFSFTVSFSSVFLFCLLFWLANKYLAIFYKCSNLLYGIT